MYEGIMAILLVTGGSYTPAAVPMSYAECLKFANAQLTEHSKVYGHEIAIVCIPDHPLTVKPKE